MADAPSRGLLPRLMPGLSELLAYRREWLRADLQAGLSVAAVALPVSIAYAQLAGFSPIIGLYSTVLPMIVYALFGSSRQLIVGPDAATCAMLGATLMPLAAPGSDAYQAYAMSLTLITGLLCVVASRFRFGFLADFLSRPILIGLLNGVAITILVSQSGKMLGLSLA
ncbi:SulP family inorganic anion transporter, partial [Dyella sp. EPa41]|uniref:SulP family inorganic anion transporter n=1 Tax=Dyella sp. EPa41 TaxID=1561194 RepID=UPI002103FB88